MENMMNNEVTTVETNTFDAKTGIISAAIGAGLFVGGIIVDKVVTKVQPIKKLKAKVEAKKAAKVEIENAENKVIELDKKKTK